MARSCPRKPPITTTSHADGHDGVPDADQMPVPDVLQEIDFIITAPDDTIVTLPPGYEQDQPDPSISASEPTASQPLVLEGEHGAQMIFNDVDMEQFDYSIDVQDNNNDEVHPQEGPDSDDENDCWIEFEFASDSPESSGNIDEIRDVIDTYESSTTSPLPGERQWSDSPQGTTTQHSTSPDDPTSNFTPSDSDSSPDSDDYPMQTYEIDIPLSHFQPLSLDLSSFTPDPPTHHPHPFPTIDNNMHNGTFTVTHDGEEHPDCLGFQLARYVAEMAHGPLPFSRRVHELQGVVQEDRMGLREWCRWMSARKVRGSPLRLGYLVEDEEDGESGEEEMQVVMVD